MKMKMNMKMKRVLNIMWYMNMSWCSGAKEDTDDDDGYVGVYVGTHNMGMYKLEIETNFLNHPLFEDLLRLSEEEFEFSYEGALRIACDLHLFQHLLHLLRTGNPSAHYLQLPHPISNYYKSTTTSTSTTTY